IPRAADLDLHVVGRDEDGVARHAGTARVRGLGDCDDAPTAIDRSTDDPRRHADRDVGAPGHALEDGRAAGQPKSRTLFELDLDPSTGDRDDRGFLLRVADLDGLPVVEPEGPTREVPPARARWVRRHRAVRARVAT